MAWVLLGALGAYIGDELALSASAKGLMVAVPLLSAAFFRVAARPARRSLRPAPRRAALDGGGRRGAAPRLGRKPTATAPCSASACCSASPERASRSPCRSPAARLSAAPPGPGDGDRRRRQLGTVLTTLAAPRIAEHVGWHAVFGLALIPVCLVWVAFAFLAKKPPAPKHPVRLADLRNILREADAWRLCGLYAVTFGTFVGLASSCRSSSTTSTGSRRSTPRRSSPPAARSARCCGRSAATWPTAPAARRSSTGVFGVGATLLLFASCAARPGPPPRSPFPLVMGAFGVGNGAVFQLVGLQITASGSGC